MRRFGLLHRSKFYHPMTEMGQNENPLRLGLCQLPTAADITPGRSSGFAVALGRLRPDRGDQIASGRVAALRRAADTFGLWG
jgi:hypothetical protein